MPWPASCMVLDAAIIMHASAWNAPVPGDVCDQPQCWWVRVIDDPVTDARQLHARSLRLLLRLLVCVAVRLQELSARLQREPVHEPCVQMTHRTASSSTRRHAESKHTPGTHAAGTLGHAWLRRWRTIAELLQARQEGDAVAGVGNEEHEFVQQAQRERIGSGARGRQALV